MTNVEQLAARFAHIPRIEETGPQHGYNGKRMTRLGRRTRLIHAIACVVGLIPFVLKLCGTTISLQVVAVGFGFVVPGGGFLACAGPATILIGLFICFILWRKTAFRIQDRYGSFFGVVGFWILGALGGLLAGIPSFERFRLTQWWAWSGYVIAIVCTFALFLPFELRVRKMIMQMKAARAKRVAAFDDSITGLAAVTASSCESGTHELSADQLKAARFLFDTTVNREEGDLSTFDRMFGLLEYRYQLSVFGYALMLLHAKYLPNFTGYLKQAHRFLIKSFALPDTCGYWPRQALTGYFSKNPDPVVKANIMLSGWMLPVVVSYHEQYRDDEFEREGSIKFQPFKDKPNETYDYSSKGIVEVLHRQYNNMEYPYMLIPCEPHRAFPTCNSFGLLGMLIYDRDHGTHYCEDFWDELYDNISQEFVEVDGSLTVRREYLYGLRHMTSFAIGYDPLADVNNYLHYLPIFPGLARRCYAQIRKHEIELREGVAYIKNKPWEKVMDIYTRKQDSAAPIALLEMVASEYGDNELYDGLLNAERLYLARSKEPGSFKFKNTNSQIMAFFAFARLNKKDFWSDVILRGLPETAFSGPLLSDCDYPGVIPAKAASDGDNLDLVLYNGTEPGEKRILIERLKPDAQYSINSGEKKFTSDGNGNAELHIYLDGRTEVMISVCE